MTEIRNASELVQHVELRISAGELQAGQRLDTVRNAARAHGLAPNTVASAYRTLGDRGFIVGQGRRGTFVAAQPALSIPPDSAVPTGLVDLATGNPDQMLLPDLGAALNLIGCDHVMYGESGDLEELLDLFATNLAMDAINAERLCIVGGALDGIERVLGSHLRPGDRVAVEDPGYSSVHELVMAMGLRPIPLSVDRFGPVADSLIHALDNGTDAIVITPRANNPTGAALDEERAADLAAVLSKRPDVLIVEDDHAGGVAGRAYHSIVPVESIKWAIVRSVAKWLGPDLRLAALAGDPTTVSRVAGRQMLGTGWVSHILQRLVTYYMSNEAHSATLSLAATSYTERRNAFADVLIDAGLDVHARSGLNVWVPVDDEAHVVAGMAQHGYAIRSGARFRQRSAPGVRISVGNAYPTTLRVAAAALVDLLTSPERSRSA